MKEVERTCLNSNVRSLPNLDLSRSDSAGVRECMVAWSSVEALRYSAIPRMGAAHYATFHRAFEAVTEVLPFVRPGVFNVRTPKSNDMPCIEDLGVSTNMHPATTHRGATRGELAQLGMTPSQMSRSHFAQPVKPGSQGSTVEGQAPPPVTPQKPTARQATSLHTASIQAIIEQSNQVHHQLKAQATAWSEPPASTGYPNVEHYVMHTGRQSERGLVDKEVEGIAAGPDCYRGAVVRTLLGPGVPLLATPPTEQVAVMVAPSSMLIRPFPVAASYLPITTRTRRSSEQ